jgi:hypothetical protein
MFKGRKARKLGIIDLGKEPNGKILSFQFLPPRFVDKIWLHAACYTRLRNGRRISNRQKVTWCSKCTIIVTEVTKGVEPS